MTKNKLYSELFPRRATTVPALRKAAKIWAKRNALISPQELERLLIACITDPRPMVKCMGGILLDYLPIQRKSLNPFLYEKWLDHVTGWGEIDAICYGHVTAEEMLADFTNWKRLLQTLSQSENINKRRAAMVFLTKPVKHSQDLRLSKLAFSLVDTLNQESSILLTKAISWLLRNLTKNHRQEVVSYLDSNKNLLPKIAVRETLNKLRTGRKSGI